jgi:cobalamin biosynthesis protein CobD/CbiB
MTAILYITAIIGWVVLSVFPGLYLATMALGGPGGPRSTFARVSMHIIYSAVIGFISELCVILAIICSPVILIVHLVERRSLNHLGYKITMDAETGDVYAYDPKTGHEVGRDLKTRNYNEIIAAIEKEYNNSNKTL